MNKDTIQILYGVRVINPIEYKLRRIRAKWWWQKDQAELIGPFGIISGDYDNIINGAFYAGIRFKVID